MAKSRKYLGVGPRWGPSDTPIDIQIKHPCESPSRTQGNPQVDLPIGEPVILLEMTGETYPIILKIRYPIDVSRKLPTQATRNMPTKVPNENSYKAPSSIKIEVPKRRSILCTHQHDSLSTKWIS